jgi:catechol 2,3-dioxygenase-like lactoylglutathione lyase family enzyme
MEQRITLVTLGVSDYGRAKAFYEALGWSPALEVDETAFFQGNGIIIALWGREKLGPAWVFPTTARAGAVSPWLTTSARVRTSMR